jgi:hypothetical protein
VFDGDVDNACIVDLVLSSSGGEALDAVVNDCLSIVYEAAACDDADNDGICDDVDDCVGEYDDCGECNGDGVDEDEDGICDDVDDCVGEYDDCGECNGDGVDEDEDGICDDVDDCVGEYDDCGECNGDGSSCEYQASIALFVEDNDGYMGVGIGNTVPIAGFQFNVSGIELLNAFGGAAEEAGFMISSNEGGTVIGFSLTGSTIPVSEEGQALLILQYEAVDSEACLNDVILSDADGNAINTYVDGCVEIYPNADDGGDDGGGEGCDEGTDVCLSLESYYDGYSYSNERQTFVFDEVR